MPTRLIRDGWLESEAVNTLTPEAERFLLRLMLRCDDFGRYHANPVLLKSNLFPLKEDVRSTDIPRWLAACELAGLVRCYEADAKPYLEVVKFDQRIRPGSVSKFPDPPLDDGNPRKSAAERGATRPKAETETKAYSKTETEAETGAAAPLLFAGEEIPTDLRTYAFKAKWSEYVAYRRQRRLPPLLPDTVKRQWAKLAGWGHDGAIASLEQTMVNQWQGLFPPKDQPKPEGAAAPIRFHIASS